MNSRVKAAALFMTILAPFYLAAAEISHTLIKESDRDTSSPAETDLSDSDIVSARLWGLSETEWRRYKMMMRGIRGSISPLTISPIEVLGIHARDDAERRRYAETWVRAMREDVDRILAFQHAYDAAGKRLYPNVPLIDIDRLPGTPAKTSALEATDRLLFFTRPKCPACDMLLAKLLKRIDEVSGIDIYILQLAPGDDDAVRDWASAHQIDTEWVRSRRITLNHDGGALARLTEGEGKSPYILRRRGVDLTKLRAKDF